MVGYFNTTYGLDPSLRHGAMVSGTYIFGQSKTLVATANVCYSWDKGNDQALTERSTTNDVYSLVQQIIDRTTLIPGRLLGMDYDATAAYWTRRPGQVALLQFMTGYFCRAVQEYGLVIIALSPRNVRNLLNLDGKASKAEVWAAFEQRVDLSTSVRRSIVTEDAKDALVLSYIVAKASWEHQNDVHTRVGETIIPRRGTPSADAIQAIIKDVAPERSAKRSRAKRD